MRPIFWFSVATMLTANAMQLGFADTAPAIKETVIGQFLTVNNNASTAQRDPLQQTFQVRFPLSVITVGDAMSYVLSTTGYHLMHDAQAYPWAEQMMKRPLPLAQRHLGPMTLQDGLQTLAGSDFQMIEDPVNRLVTFRVKPSLGDLYDPLVAPPEPATLTVTTES